jgi:hypothetical protein
MVYHEDTYKWACFHTDLREWVDKALQELIPAGTSLTNRELVRYHSGLPHGISKTAIRVFQVYPDLRPAPVDNTLKSLAKGFVYHLADRLTLFGPFDAASRPVWGAIDKLLGAHILVVPFRWPVGRADNGRLRPGGCLFAVICPKSDDQLITIDCLKDIAVRLGWVLFRAALAEVCPHEPMHQDKQALMLDRVKGVLEFRTALEAAETFAPAERFRELESRLPWLKDAFPEDRRDLLMTQLRSHLVEEKHAAIWKFFCQNYTGMHPATLYAKQKELVAMGLLDPGTAYFSSRKRH